MARYKHPTVDLTKKAFLVRMSFIITRICEVDVTQKEVAKLVGCSASQISAIKNEREKSISLETLMRVADSLRLSYTIEYRSVNGKVTQSFKMESAIDYMKNSPIRVIETGIRVIVRKPSVIMH